MNDKTCLKCTIRNYKNFLKETVYLVTVTHV